MSFVPTWFFFWGPALIATLYMVLGVYGQRFGIARTLERDWNGYSVADAGDALDRLGQQGRDDYRHLLAFDAAFAFLYALVGQVIALGLIMRGFPLGVGLLCGGGWMLGGVADIVENAALSRLAERFPKIAPGLVRIASICTVLKNVLFVAGTIGALAAFAIVATHGF
jgi:hypothetical protein